MVSGKQFMQQIKEEEVNFSLIGKPKLVRTSTNLMNLL
jgi:hypothetical protein